MAVAIIKLPVALPAEPRLAQRVMGVFSNWGIETAVTLLLPDEAAKARWYDEILSALDLSQSVTVRILEPQVTYMPGACWLVFQESPEDQAEHPAAYRIFSHGRILPPQGEAISEETFPYLKTHIFNSLSPYGKGDVDFECFTYFPYGYVYRKLGLGPVDVFGHRIKGDFREMRDRDEHRKLVLCFGGSAVFGLNVLFEQAFPYQLEQLLNQEMKRVGSRTRFTVLNFGIPGGVVLNTIERFILFGLDLRPDFVISHDGINDLFYAYTSDGYLQTEQGIVYQPNLEYWAKSLFDPTSDREKVYLGGSIGGHTGAPPIASLRAFLRRKREFARIVRGTGGRFIAGLQPYSGSKKTLTETERNRISAWRGTPQQYVAEFQMIEAHYQRLLQEKPTVGADAEINFHQVFQMLDDSENHFSDMVHMDVSGERVIARQYAETIVSMEQGGKR